MDRKENLLATLRHEPHDHVSCLGRDMYRVGGIHDTFDNGPAGGGRDGFGTLWVATDSAFGGATPVTSAAPLDSLCDWQNRVTFPNLADHDWSGFAEADLAAFNRDERVLCYDIWNAQFLRFTHILGIENALCALKDDPEESRALLDAITTWTISYAQHAYAAYHPDVICIFDCFATQRGLFVSPTCIAR